MRTSTELAHTDKAIVECIMHVEIWGKHEFRPVTVIGKIYTSNQKTLYIVYIFGTSCIWRHITKEKEPNFMLLH